MLQVNTNDPNGPLSIQLHGIGTQGLYGYLEPSLVQILRANDIPTIVGAGVNDVNVNASQYPINPDPTSQEVPMQRLIKAGPGAVTITSLATFNATAPSTVRFGYYTPGDPTDTTELFTIGQNNAQSVNPTPLGATSFDPGSNAFGLYATFPGTWIGGKGLLDTHYSEDALNTLDTAHPRKFRFFPMQNPDGTNVPNAYIIAAEDYNSTTYNSFVNFVGIIRNVKAAPDAVNAPVLGLTNLDGIPSTTRMVFNRIQIPNPTTADIVHDTGSIQINNTGDQPLVINSLTLSDTTNWMLVNAPAPGTSIPAGKTLTLTVKFIAQTDSPHTASQINDSVTTNGVSPVAAGGVWNGTLVITTNDPVTPSRTIQLAGWWQHQTEHENEPGLQTLTNLIYGWGTTIASTQLTDYPNIGGKATYYGEEAPAGLWDAADPTQPVSVRQLAVYHNEIDASVTPNIMPAAVFGYYYPGSKASFILQNQPGESQSLLPTLKGSLVTQAKASFTPTGTFGLNVDNERSQDSLNVTDATTYGRTGHAMRIYPVRDSLGNLIPNQWLVVMDYQNGQYDNSDYQDNMYLVTNMRPDAQAPAPTDVQATGSAGGIALQWAHRQ